jgi:hypothetical protein
MEKAEASHGNFCRYFLDVVDNDEGILGFMILVDEVHCHSSDYVNKYVGESNENRKTEIKVRNITPLSYKLADMLPML